MTEAEVNWIGVLAAVGIAAADGAFHEYALDLAEHPDWKGDVDELWFEASQIMHARVAVDWMRFE